MTGGIRHTPSYTNVCKFVQISTYIFPADVTPDMLKLCRVTKVQVLFLFLVSVQFQFNFNSFKSIASILEKGLLWDRIHQIKAELGGWGKNLYWFKGAKPPNLEAIFFSFTKHNLSHYGIGYNSAAYGLHNNIWEKHV